MHGSNVRQSNFLTPALAQASRLPAQVIRASLGVHQVEQVVIRRQGPIAELVPGCRKQLEVELMSWHLLLTRQDI